MTDAFAAAGYDARSVGFGRRAAIVVVDFQLGFTGGVSPMAQSPHVGAAVDPRVLADSDAVIEKRFPSAFFGTDAASILRFWDVDTVIVMGCTSSGCVRASIIDAFSHRFRTIVAEDCCGDQDAQAHADNMRDVGLRYADVMSGADVLSHLPASSV